MNLRCKINFIPEWCVGHPVDSSDDDEVDFSVPYMKFIPPGSLREEMHLSWSLDNVHRVVVRVDSTLLVWQRREGVVVHGKQAEAVPLRNVHDDSAWLKDDGCTPWSLERNYHVVPRSFQGVSWGCVENGRWALLLFLAGTARQQIVAKCGQQSHC